MISWEGVFTAGWITDGCTSSNTLSAEHPRFATSKSFSFLLPQPQILFSAMSHNTSPLKLLETSHGLCDCIPLSLPSCLLGCSYFLRDPSFCQSHLVFHYTQVSGNIIGSQDLNHHLCLDEFQICPSINFPLPTTLLSFLLPALQCEFLT